MFKNLAVMRRPPSTGYQRRQTIWVYKSMMPSSLFQGPDSLISRTDLQIPLFIWYPSAIIIIPIMIYLLPLLITQLWLPQTHAAAIERSPLEITASEVTPPPTTATPPPVAVDECSLQPATAQILCTIEDSLPDSKLLNVSYIHHIPEGLADTANTQHLDSSTSPSTVNYDMISAIFEGLGLLIALFWGPFAKLYWDKVRSTNTSSNSEFELELGSSGSQTA